MSANEPAEAAETELRRGLKRAVRKMLALHAIPVAVLLVLYLGVVPIFGEIYSGGSRLPRGTEFVIGLSILPYYAVFLIVPALVVLFWIDKNAYLFFNRRFGKAVAGRWDRGFVWAIVALCVLTTWALMLPIWKMRDIISPGH